MVGALALDAQRIWTAPIALGDQALVGAAAVVLPGTTFGKAAILAVGSAAAAGSTLAGSPTTPRLLFLPSGAVTAGRLAAAAKMWAGTMHASPTRMRSAGAWGVARVHVIRWRGGRSHGACLDGMMSI